MLDFFSPATRVSGALRVRMYKGSLQRLSRDVSLAEGRRDIPQLGRDAYEARSRSRRIPHIADVRQHRTEVQNYVLRFTLYREYRRRHSRSGK